MFSQWLKVHVLSFDYPMLKHCNTGQLSTSALHFMLAPREETTLEPNQEIESDDLDLILGIAQGT
jgi:hypothetical protein